jgi:hypothetical protein
MWIILAFSVCLAAQPDRCEDRELTFSTYDVTILQCQAQGLAMLAQWASTHPRWKISGRYRCRIRRNDEGEA